MCCASGSLSPSVRLSNEILKFITDAYRQIRNTLRFIIGNLADFDPTRDAIEELPELVCWTLARLQDYLRYSLNAYERFEYHLFYHETRRFCNVELSAFYLDVLKDRLYASAASDPARRAAQTVLYEVTSTLREFCKNAPLH